jgi:hypothetical protein
MVPPGHQLPAAPILQVSAIAVHRAIDHNPNTAMYFLMLTLTFMYSSSARLLTKGEFLKIYLVLFLCRCIETTCIKTSYLLISYLVMSPKYSSCFGLILDRGGGCHCHNVFRKVEVGLVVVSVALLILVNT